eukprot:17214-Heterococcus_DN1.PRE.3
MAASMKFFTGIVLLACMNAVTAWIAPAVSSGRSAKSLLKPRAAAATVDAQAMEVVYGLKGLGIELGVGESLVAPGSRGLYARLMEDREPVTLPQFTPIVVCAKGEFTDFLEADAGDKTVAFILDSLETAVVFEDRMMQLGEAVSTVYDEDSDPSAIIAGHTLLFNEAEGTQTLQPGSDEHFPVFMVPYEQGERPALELGQYANDLAYSAADSQLDVDSYWAAAAEKNSLCLVWRLERDPQRPARLVPTYPVSVLSKKVTFDSREFTEQHSNASSTQPRHCSVPHRARMTINT